MDAKNIKETRMERLTKFMIIQFVRIVFVGVFSMGFSLFPIAVCELFVMISNKIGYGIEISTQKVVIICYVATYIFIYYHLIIKNRNDSKNGL